MKDLSLPDVLITVKSSVVQITHRKTGMVVCTTLAKLNTWALQQLRKELVVKEKI